MIFNMTVEQDKANGDYYVSCIGQDELDVQYLRLSKAKTPATAISKARRDISRMETAINRMKL